MMMTPSSQRPAEDSQQIARPKTDDDDDDEEERKTMKDRTSSERECVLDSH